HLDEHRGFHHRLDGGVKLPELAGKDRFDVEVKADGAFEITARAHDEHVEHARVGPLRQITEKPAVAQEIDIHARQVAQVGDIDVVLVEHPADIIVGRHRAYRLAAEDAAQVGLVQVVFHVRQARGREQLHHAFLQKVYRSCGP